MRRFRGICNFQSWNRDFLRYSLYWIYCTIAIWTFRTLISEKFLSSVRYACEINLIFQMIVLISGKGRYFHEAWGGSRFMGTFNDPNQFAFFMFTMLLFLFLYYSTHYEKKELIIFLAIAVFLIYCSKSTGIFTGLAAFLLILFGNWFWMMYKKSDRKSIWVMGATVGIVGVIVLTIAICPRGSFDITQTSYSLVARIQQKIWKLSNGNLSDLLYDRSAERLVLWPKYLIYGAGEGNFERFLPGEDFIRTITPGVFDVVRVNEIHSSFFNVCYSYGIIPTVILLCWIWKNARLCNRWQLAAVVGILVESFTLMNCRQPFFWFILVYISAVGDLFKPVEHSIK